MYFCLSCTFSSVLILSCSSVCSLHSCLVKLKAFGSGDTVMCQIFPRKLTACPCAPPPVLSALLKPWVQVDSVIIEGNWVSVLVCGTSCGPPLEDKFRLVGLLLLGLGCWALGSLVFFTLATQHTAHRGHVFSVILFW
jgi:hypothetical protein